MWLVLERVVLVLGAIVMGKEVTDILRKKKRIDPNEVYFLEEVKGILGMTIDEVVQLVKDGRLIAREVEEKYFVLGLDLLRFLMSDSSQGAKAA